MNHELMQQLAQAGIHLPGDVELMPAGVSHNYDLAMDAQPGLVTVSNAGIPSYLANYIDPKLIEVLVAPMKAAEILGETKKGDWTSQTLTFSVVESTGETSAYGDYSQNGSTGVNANFPQRQPFHYQTMTQWGERELAMAGLAKIDWASRLNIASALVLNKFQNKSYFFGIANLQNYGLLNDPLLSTPLTPTALWSLSGTTGDVVYEDIRRMFVQLQVQVKGVVDQDAKMVLALDPTSAVALNKTNQYNVNVSDNLAKNFPNLRIVTAPEYTTVSGNLVQMIVEEHEGQETGTCAFTEKMRAHGIVRLASAFLQKKSQGTAGTVLFRPVFISQMLGV